MPRGFHILARINGFSGFLFKKLEASQVVEFAHDATLQFMPVPHHPYREELLPNIPSNLSSVSWRQSPLSCHFRLSSQAPPGSHTLQARKGKGIQTDIIPSFHILCMLKYLWPQHTWHIKKYYTLEECWKKVILQHCAHFGERDVTNPVAGCLQSRFADGIPPPPWMGLQSPRKCLGFGKTPQFGGKASPFTNPPAPAPLEWFPEEQGDIPQLVFPLWKISVI